VRSPIPSSANALWPHAYRAPSASTAKLLSAPDAMETAGPGSVTLCGFEFSDPPEVPRSEFLSPPQIQTVPSLRRAMECESPAATAIQRKSFELSFEDSIVKLAAIWMGNALASFEPSPNWPNSFAPHVQSVPSDFTTKTWRFPSAKTVWEFALGGLKIEATADGAL